MTQIGETTTDSHDLDGTTLRYTYEDGGEVELAFHDSMVKFSFRGRGTNAASRAMKSAGANFTCVVPSRKGRFSLRRTSPRRFNDREEHTRAQRQE